MSSLVLIDGRPHAAEAATVSVFDRGFLYGDSVFETLRTYGGRVFALDRHLQRLAKSAASVYIDLPVSLEQLGREVESAVVGAGNAESYVRLMLTRGTGSELGLDPGLSRHALRVVIVTPLKSPPPEQYARGIAAISYRTERLVDGTAAVGAKLGNYLTAVLASRAMRDAGAGEALILDAQGRVIEGATSNVFAVRGERTLVTPPESAGILLGITRQVVLDVAAELRFEVELVSLPLAELRAASEVFVSSSIREIMPVVSIDGVAVGAGTPGPATLRLLERLREVCRSERAG